MFILLKNIRSHVLLKHLNFKPSLPDSVASIRSVSSDKTISKGLFSSVRKLWSKHPLVSNCITYGILYSGSEFIQQTILRNVAEDGEEIKEYDFGTVFRLINQFLVSSVAVSG